LEKVRGSTDSEFSSSGFRAWFGGLVFKAHRLLHHSTLDLRVIKKKKKVWSLAPGLGFGVQGSGFRV